MDRADHHHEAERLLSDALKEQDSIRRSVILAEAQLHATLALSAEPGTSPPGPGQPETRSSARGEELVLVPAELLPYLRYLPGSRWPDEPGRQPGDITPRSPSEGSPLPWSDRSQMIEEAQRKIWDAHIKMMRESAAPAPAGQTPTPPYPEPSRRRRRRPTEQPGEREPGAPGGQEPDATKRPRAPDNPAGQKSGKPDEPEPGGLRPF